MNIYLREIKANRKSLIIWCIGMLFMIAAGMGKYSGLSASAQATNDFLSQLPEAVKKIMSMNSFDMTKAIGFFAMLYLYLAIMASIHSSMLGANIIAKEEVDKTTEFLYVKPASRNKIITAKLLAVLTNVFVINIITSITSAIVVAYYSKGEAVIGDVITLMLGMLFMQLIFAAVGAGTAAIGRRPKIAASIATVVLMITFLVSMAIDVNSKLDSLKYVTPFKYFDAKNLLTTGFQARYIILTFVVITALTGLTYSLYNKRDLNV